ncbi:MAG: insulinase family protein, partial [Bacteroidales bacterium]|nr:insulinase family protein [Bacteroidales bacterium]
MKRILTLSIACLFICGLFLQQANAQQTYNLNDPLPVNPKVKIGKLPNGLTYYIQANKKPENRATFFLAVNAGSVLEDTNQIGLAHFAEHMGFNGTKQFPGNTLIDELEKKGIIFGRGINAWTSFEETCYYVTLPTDDTALFNTGLKALDAWGFGMLMSGAEIEKERGVIIEEHRLHLGASDRLRQKTWPIMLKGSLYADRLPIGTLKSLQTFKHNDIRSFYKKWYRTDNMAIVIVGDFDPAYMEQMLVDFFTMNDRPSTTLERPKYHIPDNKEPLVAIASDPEASGTSISLFFKQTQKEYKTYGDFRSQMLDELFSSMLNARFAELSEKKDCPFMYGYSFYGSFLSRTNEAFAVVSAAKENKGMPALELMLKEVRRVQQHGFLQSELERAKIEYLAGTERMAKEADKKESPNFCRSYAGNFLDEAPIYGDSLNHIFSSYFMNGIKLEEINALINKYITNENIVVNFTLQEKKGVKMPTEKDVLGMIEKTMKSEQKPYEDAQNAAPFLTKEPSGGKIVSKTDNAEFNYTEYKLSNGATVVVKKTDFKNDEILMRAFSPGGMSLYPESQYVNTVYGSYVINGSGIGNYSPTDLQKFMMGKNFSLWSNVGYYSEGLNGNSVPKDFEYFLQHLFMVFEAPRKDVETYERQIDEWRNQISMYANNPDVQFIIFSMKQQYPQEKMNPMITESDIKTMNLEEMYKIYRERFNNASDFTFIFVGNIEEKDIALIEKYIGGISSTGKSETIKDIDTPLAKGLVDKTLYMGLEDKTAMQFKTEMPYEWNAENILLTNVLNKVISIKMTENIREKMGGTYGIGASLSFSKVPKAECGLSIRLGCQPERVDEITAEIWRTMDELIANGPSETDLNKAKEQLIREKETNLKENRTWVNYLNTLYGPEQLP